MTVLQGSTVTLRPATPADVAALVSIRETPEVQARWGGADDLEAEMLDDLAAPDYRHAGIDLYVDPADQRVSSCRAAWCSISVR